MFDRSILVRVWITCIIISNSNIWIRFLFTPFTPISLACMLLQVAITLFSPSHPHAHFMFLLSSQTWSLDVSLEKFTLSLSLYIIRFSLSLTSLLFSASTRYLSFLFHRHTHSLHSSFTLSFSLWDSLTHPICLYIWIIPLKLLSLSPVDTTFAAVSFSSPYQTDIIHLFTDQTNSPLSLIHTHNSCFHSPSRLPSLSHTHKTLAFAPRLVFLSQTFID